MCRICGRMVKCIFDSMPSRVHHVPSRRAFTTIRRITTSQPIASIPRFSSFSSTFSRLSLTPSPILRSTTRPSVLSVSSRITAVTQSPSSISAPRTFSTTAAVSGYRRRMDTYSPSRRVQKRRHGYLSRLRHKDGIAILKRRKLKGRKNLSW